MSLLAIHVEDENDWRDEVRRELAQIEGFDIKHHLRSVETIDELERELRFFKGNLLIIMDLRHGETSSPNYDGFHWLIEDLPRVIKNNASTSVYIVSGRLGSNEIARDTLLRQPNIPVDHIFDKGEWYKNSEKFVELIRRDIENMHNVSFKNISTGISGKVIDPFLIHDFHILSKTDDELMEKDELGIDNQRLLPMLVKVKNKEWNFNQIPDLKVISKIEQIYGCLGSVKSLAALEADANVINVEASRSISNPECDVSVPFIKGNQVHNEFSEGGENSLIGFIDTGIDLLHDAFLESSGTSSRILAIWDQRDPTGPSPAKLGYNKMFPDQYNTGTLHTTDAIARYIANKAVPKFLQTGPKDHGTHVASIAAGKPTKHFAGGVAPNAKLLVVIPRTDFFPGAPKSLGYSLSYHAGLAFIRDFANTINMPVVINVSHGMNAGAHDGTSNLEVSFDQITEMGKSPGIVIVKSAGNERNKSGHAYFQVPNGGLERLEWRAEKPHRNKDEIELWFDPGDILRFRLVTPRGEMTDWIGQSKLSEKSEFKNGNDYLIKYDPLYSDNGLSRLAISIDPGKSSTIQKGTWTLLIEGLEIISNGSVHAWLERRLDRSVRFLNHVSEDFTLSIPGTAHSVITVGSVSPENPIKLALASSYGPTLDNRNKPDLCAPGENILAAQSNTFTKSFRDSGTSMAAPHVTGTIALCFSALQRLVISQDITQKQFNAVQIASALVISSQGYRNHWQKGIGFGILDTRKFFRILFGY